MDCRDSGEVVKEEDQNVSLAFYDVFFLSRFGAPRFGGSRGGPLSGKKFGNPGEKLTKKKWNLDELPKFEKNFYQEHPDVVRRTAVCT